MERIETAAVRFTVDDEKKIMTLPRPNRHDDVYCAIANSFKSFRIVEAGFMTSENRYVNRSEAAKIAQAANQIISDDFSPSELFTEDLW